MSSPVMSSSCRVTLEWPGPAGVVINRGLVIAALSTRLGLHWWSTEAVSVGAGPRPGITILV